MKKFHGFVIGKTAVKNGFIYLVETERRKDFTGVYVDTVYSTTEYFIADEIEYHFKYNGKEYRAYA